MIVNVVILDSAEQDLKELRRYILKNFSVEIWEQTYRKLKDAMRNLQKFLLAGSIPEEIAKLNLTQYRQIISGMNRIIYEVRHNVIYIHLISDSRRELGTLLANRFMRNS